jgi:hypothetical protein
MLIWLTICNSVAAVRSGPVSPNGNTTPNPNGNTTPNNNGNTPSTTGNGSQDTNLDGSFKYCRCVDANQNELNTPTNNVYQGYLQSLGSGVTLGYDSAGAPYVSHSVFIITSRSLTLFSFHTFLSFFSLANFFFITSVRTILIGMAMILKLNVWRMVLCRPSAGTKSSLKYGN